MKAELNQIQYDPDYFDADFVRFVTAPEAPPLAAEPVREPEALVPPERSVDPEALFDEVWQRLQADPDFAPEAAELEALREEARARALGPPALGSAADAELATALEVSYTVTAAADGFSHRLGGVEVLRIPLTLAGSKKADARTRMIISAAKVAVDAMMIFACACGVRAARMKHAAARTIAKTAATQAAALTAASAKLAQAAKIADRVNKMKAVAAVMYEGLDTWAMAKGIVSDMPWRDRALTIAAVLANLGLAFASGGAAVWMSIATLAVALLEFAKDVSVLAKDHAAWRVA
jgi:hypothetical protein